MMKTTDLLILGVAGVAIYYLFFRKGGMFDIGGGSVGGGGSGSTSGDTVTAYSPFIQQTIVLRGIAKPASTGGALFGKKLSGSLLGATLGGGYMGRQRTGGLLAATLSDERIKTVTTRKDPNPAATKKAHVRIRW